MESKLQELTEKIYSEGVEKGKEEAEKIITKAKSEADSIIKNAKAEAEKIILQAQQKSNELLSKTESELKLSVRQAINALKQQITAIVVAKTIDSGVKQSFNDTEFIKDLILAIVKNWNPATDSQIDLEVQLPAGKEKELQSFFTTQAKSILSKGVKFNFNNRLTNGFEISPSDRSYKISFTDDDFIRFFSEYLRPKLSSMLFEGEK
jgi:V/A-type H+-transporting ATPase subunit E